MSAPTYPRSPKQQADLRKDMHDMALLLDHNRAGYIEANLWWAFEIGFCEGKDALREELLDAKVEGADISLDRHALATAMRRAKPMGRQP